MGDRVNPGGGKGGGSGGPGGGGGSAGTSSLAFQSGDTIEDPLNFGGDEEPDYSEFFRHGPTLGGRGGGIIIGPGSGAELGGGGVFTFTPKTGAPGQEPGGGGPPSVYTPPSTVITSTPSLPFSGQGESPARLGGIAPFFREDEFVFKRKRRTLNKVAERPPEIQREIKVAGGFGESVEKSIARREAMPRYAIQKDDDFLTKLFKLLLPP